MACFIQGRVRKINPKTYEKIPHIGWNSVIQLKKSKLMKFLIEATFTLFTAINLKFQRIQIKLVKHHLLMGLLSSE